MKLIRAGLVGLWLVAGAAPARADATAFASLTKTRTARPGIGFAFGGGLPMIRYEIEYARSARDPDKAAPSLSTVAGNLVVHIAGPTRGTQFYGAAGVGIYGESFGNGRGSTGPATNIGGGAKIALAGPLRLRLDYRVFFLRGTPDGSPVYSKPQRVYAGLNLTF